MVAKKRVRIDHFVIFLPQIFGENDVLGIFVRCSHHERPHFDLAVLLQRWCSLRNNLRTVRQVRHVSVSSFPCFINSVVPMSRMSDHERGPSNRGFVCRKFL